MLGTEDVVEDDEVAVELEDSKVSVAVPEDVVEDLLVDSKVVLAECVLDSVVDVVPSDEQRTWHAYCILFASVRQ